MRTVGLSGLNVSGVRQTNFPHGNRPYIGNNPLMTSEEYKNRTRPVCVAYAATFDVARPNQTKHGRTLGQILTRVASGEYRLFCPFDKKWVTSPRYGLRQFISIQWIETYDVDSADFDRLARTKR